MVKINSNQFLDYLDSPWYYNIKYNKNYNYANQFRQMSVHYGHLFWMCHMHF